MGTAEGRASLVGIHANGTSDLLHALVGNRSEGKGARQKSAQKLAVSSDEVREDALEQLPSIHRERRSFEKEVSNDRQIAVAEGGHQRPPLRDTVRTLEQVNAEEPYRSMPERRFVSRLQERREVGSMVEEDSKASPVSIEVVREREAIVRHLHEQLIGGERSGGRQRTRVKGVNRDRDYELVCLRLSEAASKLPARETIGASIDLCAPEPLSDARLADPTRSIDARSSVEATNHQIEELEVREERPDLRLKEKAR
jgi:hypothetical protein